ncbi:hypothetical protein HY631_03440 [Candidatus Uhrbacteria bacterium]|nr:hypothetical protein [Candidatus Uhrbacteria bacterium]
MSVLLIFSLALPALAQESTGLTSAMNVGVSGLVSTPDGAWLGQYVYFGPGITIPLSQRFLFIPNLTFEAAPGVGNWGLVANAIIEYAPPGLPFAFDIMPSLYQDTAPDGRTAFLWGVGPGATLILKSGVTLSACAQFVGVVGDPVTGVALSPILNLGVPIPSNK